MCKMQYPINTNDPSQIRKSIGGFVKSACWTQKLPPPPRGGHIKSELSFSFVHLDDAYENREMSENFFSGPVTGKFTGPGEILPVW